MSERERARILGLRGQRGDDRWSYPDDFGMWVEDHDSWKVNLERELARAATFRRSVALVMFRSLAPSRHGRKWIEDVRSVLRSFDRIAIYSADTVEVALSETDLPEALAFARRIAGGELPIVCGVGVYPRHARSVEELLEVTRTALLSAEKDQTVCAARRRHREVVRNAPSMAPIVISPVSQRVYEIARQVATAAIPVLIVGETGVGKEVVARVIHQGSGRGDHPIVCVNCGGLSSELVESTLFGHEKGAFTGADRRVAGVFETADTGSVLLDEVGELSLSAQVSLLRVLETKRFARVGGNVEQEVDVRVMAATHQNLEQMVEAGRFRQDLLFRLDAIRISIPPLRQRPEEIEPLVVRFVREANRRNGSQVDRVEPDALKALRCYPWPGNVRELRNAIERAVVIARHRSIRVDDLPERVRGLKTLTSSALGLEPSHVDPIDLRAEVSRYEKTLILRALRQTGWHRRQAALLLGLPLRTLAHKIHQHGIDPDVD